MFAGHHPHRRQSPATYTPAVILDPGRRPDLTPPAWRATAIALLAIGTALGVRIGRMRAPRVAAASGLAGGATVALVHAGSLRARRARIAGTPPSDAGPAPALPRLTVVVAARDEIRAIPGLMHDLGRQDLRDLDGLPAFDVVVVDDRSTDGSGAAARRAADEAGLGPVTSVVRRHPGSRPDGKGAALASVPDDLLRGAAVFVLDADARLGPDALRRAAAIVGDGCTAFTARRRVSGRGRSDVVQDDEQTLDLFIQQARGALGGCPELRGNGMVVPTGRLRAAGGWRAGALTEDLDLSTRLAVGGTRVIPARDLEVWEAPTATLPAFARQRLRWAEGSVRRFLDLLPAAVASPELPWTAKADLGVSVAQLTLPTVLVGALAEGARRRTIGSGLALAGGYVGTAWVLAVLALGDDAHDEPASPGRAARALVAATYLLHWVAAAPAALVCVALRPSPVGFAMTRDRRLPPD